MSFGRPGGFTDAFKPSPPARGSFPLDHDGECKHAMIMHLKCLKENQNNNGKCRLEAMRYLQCRMDKLRQVLWDLADSDHSDLMTKDNMANLGLGDVLPPDQQSAATTITTALAKEPITGETPSTSSVPVSTYSNSSQQTRI